MSLRARMPVGAMLAAATVAAALVGCSSSTPAAEVPTGPNVVTVTDNTYSPANVTVNVGDTVTWYFNDRGVAHNVVGTGPASTMIHSPLISSGQFSHTFDTAGTFDYTCTVHPDMMGSIVVR